MRLVASALGVLALGALWAAPAFGTLVASEDFSAYTVAAPLNGQGAAGGGWAGAWYPASTNLSWWDPANTLVATPGFTYAPDYTNPVSGQTASGGFTRLFRQLAAPTSGMTYVSFVAPANAMSQFDLNSGSDGDNSRVAAIQWAGTGGTTINVLNGTLPTAALDQPSTEDYQTSIGATSATAADLYVITLDATTSAVGYYVFLNGTSPISGTANYGITMINDASRGASIDRVGLFTIFSAGVSDIRIGTTAADVGVSPNALVGAPIPEPASLGLLALGGVALLRRRK